MAKGPTKEIMTRAFIVMMALVFVGFGVTSVSLSYIMLVKGDEYRTLAQEQQLRDTVTKAQRGNIYDSNMNVLATSATVWQVYVTPASMEKSEKEVVAKGISKLLKMEYEDVLKKVNMKTGYETVGKPVDLKKSTKIREFIKENKVTSVVGLEETNERYYPNQNLASTVLGFVGTDNQGLGGIEYTYDQYLTGTPGRVVAAKNAKGADLPFSYEKQIDATPGNSVVLTIDEYIQHVVEKYLDQAIEENNVRNRGSAIVMDVNSGSILAMATKPDFDPNEPFTVYDVTAKEKIDSLSGKEKSAEFAKAQQEQWRNKAVSDVYEPGSVFKIMTASAALEEHTTKTTDSYHCPGFIKIANRTIKCHNTNGHGSQSLAQGFMNSCNPVFIGIGQTLGIDKFAKYRRSFGLETKTGIDLPGESSPIYHTKSSMGVVELASESFGQTFKISPIQLISAISASVNGGKLYKPHILKQVVDSNNNVIKNYESEVVRQVISEETSKLINGYLEGVVREGTGKNSYVAGYRIGGKTGTSQKIDLQDESGAISKYIASFCGIAPSNSPQIAILMLLDEPDVFNPYGGTLVAPFVGKMFAEILPYMGVTPEYTEEEAEKLEKTTPDLIGKTTAVAKRELQALGLDVKIVGSGEKVLKQTPSASSTIPAGGQVVLYTQDDDKKRTVTVPSFKGLSVAQANLAASNAGVNIAISGVTKNSTAYTQSIEAGEEVEAGTVITVGFRENITVE